MDNIKFFLKIDKQVIQLPTNPPELKIVSGGNNKSEEVVKLGEINILRQIKLKTCSFTSFFPKENNAPYINTYKGFKEPQFYIDLIQKARDDKKPIIFTISHTNINMLMAIESFDIELRAGDNDIYYTLALKEYRPYKAIPINIVNVKPTIKNEPKPLPKLQKESKPRQKTGFAIGDTVIVNGRYHSSSYGDKPFGNFKEFSGKISHIVTDKSRAYQYHITTIDGGYRGWVSESQIKHS